MKRVINLLPLTLLTTPSLALAQLNGTGRLIVNASYLVDALTVMIAAIAILVFFWGLVKYILKIGGDAKAVADGKQLMIWGTVALFVMISVWGLVRFIQGEILPGGDFSNPTVPTFNGR